MDVQVTDLKEIDILKHLSDKELKNIATIHVYGDSRIPEHGLSAIYVTKDDGVYATGFNRLVAGYGSEKMVITSGEELILKTSVKIAPLCGVKVKKIVVGKSFGAALTGSNELYFWGLAVMQVNPNAVVMVRKYSPGKLCMKCSRPYSEFTDYGSSLSRCNSCDCFVTYSYSSPPPPGIPVNYLVDGSKVSLSEDFNERIKCLHCGVEAKKTAQSRYGLVSYWYSVEDFRLLFCWNCSRFLDATLYGAIPPQTDVFPHKVELDSSLQIVDISSGEDFLMMQTASNAIVVWGTIGTNKYKNYVINPDNAVIEKVSCGSNHMAVVSREGKLYTCGVGIPNCLGYDWNGKMGHMTFREVPLNEPALNVVCGNTSTMCIVRGETIKAIPIGPPNLACVAIPDLLCVPASIVSQLSDQNSMSHLGILKRGNRAIMTGGPSNIFVPRIDADKLVSLSTTRDRQEASQADATNDSTPIPPAPQFSLFGKNLFSDLTLVLSDGNFPSHWPILSTSSAFFSQLAQTDPPTELDVSAYNPESYRSLLKYFYRVPLGQLSCRDLFDLYLLADSYKEQLVAYDVLSKLKKSITLDTVVPLYDMAVTANVAELVDDCKSFIKKPQFKALLLQRLTQEDVLLDLLRLSSFKTDTS